MKTNRRDFIKYGTAAMTAWSGLARGATPSPAAPDGKTVSPQRRIPAANGQNLKRIPVRMFWNWDHSTTWCENVYGAQNFGVGNGYTKNGRFFEMDYRRVIDWCAAHDMQAICVAGLLRDRHGGVEAVRRICGYGRDKGVRICIIGGLFAYGGAFYEGNHKYSLDSFLEANKDCMARTAGGAYHYARFVDHGGSKYEPQGCPSSEKLRAFVVESYDWLFGAVPELGGIQMEAGDNGVCQCDRCKQRRGARAAKDFKSLEDMAAIYPRVCAAVRGRNKDALVIAETYHHFLDDACRIFADPNPGADAQALLGLPKDVYFQWMCDERLDKDEWPEDARLPPALLCRHNVMRSHAGTQWWGGRDRFDADKIRRQCRLSSLAGYNAVSMFGETSPFHANAEFNYLALRYFADAPGATLDGFAKDEMAPRLGGVERAGNWIAWSKLDHAPEKIPAATAQIAKILGGETDAEIRRRWMQFGSRLESFHWEWERNGHKLPVYARHAEPMKKTQKYAGAAHLE